MKIRILLPAVSFLLLFCSCLRSIYGIRQPSPLSDAQIIQKAQQFRIPMSRLYKLDSLYAVWIYHLQHSGYTEMAKHLHQPLQVMYFDSVGRMVSLHLNCHAFSFPNLKWNRSQAFEQFPPPGNSPVDQMPKQHIIQKMLKPFHCTDTSFNVHQGFTAIIFWNGFMGRQSKRLIRLVQRNAALFANEKINLIYVNDDNYHAIGVTSRFGRDAIAKIDGLITAWKEIQNQDSVLIPTSAVSP